MAGNRFNIPTFDLDLLNWANNAKAYNANRARERQQDWNNIFGAAAGLGSQIRAEKEAEKAREAAAEAAALREKHQDVQAQLQREFQAEEAEKARKFQAAQNAENRKAQQDYNMALRGMEQAKLDNKEKDAAQTEYATLLGKETPTGGELMRMNQLRQKFPELDKYNTGKINDQGMPIYGSLYEDSIAQRNAARDEALRYAKFKNSMPTTFKNAKEKEYWQNQIEKQGFDSGRTAELYNHISGNKDLKTKTGEAVQGAIANAAAKSTTEKIDDAKAKEESKQYVGGNSLKWSKIPPEIKKHLKLNSTTGKIEEK
jgi:hypothetical protein